MSKKGEQASEATLPTIDYLLGLATEAVDHFERGDPARACQIYGHALVEATQHINRLQARIIELERAVRR